MSVGKVYLIGAGCGRYDLITIRGANALKKCDVVLYDSLIDSQLLDFLPENCEKIYVGKRAGKHCIAQQEINKLLVKKAKEGKIIARLKGGDPFIFGRGSEEALFLMENDVPFKMIPGISSAYAVPEMAGIPVTHRGISRSFHVITGHTKDDMLLERFSLYARLDGTLVFLMGLNNIGQIAENLIKNGKTSDTPTAIISNGGTALQRIARGKLAEISEIAKADGICSPAVIVVGETVEFDLNSYEKDPLDGVSVTVTGTKRFAYKLAEKLNDLGANVSCKNIFDVIPYVNDEKISEISTEIFSCTMIVLTSQNGAEIFFDILKKAHIDIRKLSKIRFAVIGNATAKVLEDHGIYADIMPQKFTSRSLAEEIIKNKTASEKILLLRAEKASTILSDILLQNKIDFKEIKIYDIKSKNEDKPKEINTNFIVFGSAYEISDLCEKGYTISEDTTAVCIGKTAAEQLKKLYRITAAIPEIQNADGIINLIKDLKGRYE